MDEIEARLRELGVRASESIAAPPPAPPSIARRARRRRAVASLGALALVAVVATGAYAGIRNFGGTPIRTADPNVLSAAAAATQEQGSARAAFEISGRIETEAGSDDIEAKGTFEMDFENQLTYIRMEFEGLSALESKVVEMVQDGERGTSYMKGMVPGSEDAWVEMVGPEDGEAGSVPGFPPSLSSDPADLIGQIEAVSGDIEIVGTDEFDGVPVTHYRATLDPDLMLEGVPEESRAGLEERLGDGETGFEPLDVWVDDVGLLRRMDLAVRYAGPGDGEEIGGRDMSMEMEMSMTFFDYGAPVDINVPSENEVKEIGELQESFEVQGETTPAADEAHVDLLGPDGFSGPVLSWDLAGQSPMFCAGNLPSFTTKAELVRESTNEVLVTWDENFEGNDLRFACVHRDLPEDLARLAENPKDYMLRISGALRATTVEFVEARS